VVLREAVQKLQGRYRLLDAAAIADGFSLQNNVFGVDVQVSQTQESHDCRRFDKGKGRRLEGTRKPCFSFFTLVCDCIYGFLI
jgi:hypothetical protein